MSAEQRFHAIPLSRRQIVDALLEELDGDDEVERFAALAKLLSALFHHEFHEQLEQLKDAYDPINPDSDMSPGELSEPELAERGDRVGEVLSEVLAKGNYRPLSKEEMQHALRERSLFPIHVAIDFDVFDDFAVYARGLSVRDGHVKRWYGLGKKRIDVPTYDRVCLYLRFKAEDALPSKGSKKRNQLNLEPGRTVLKLFRNIPKADLEMLFPNTQLKMRLIDKLIIGVPAVVGGVPVAVKLAPALFALAILFGLERGEVNETAVIAGLSGMVGLGLFLFRQFDKFKSRKLLFLKMLSETFYFRNTDNNEGVLTRLIDDAEEEECKEALLAYVFLRRSPGLTAKRLDEQIEGWLQERFDVDVDFEIDDALAKLVRLELAQRSDEGGYEVLPLFDALVTLDRRWDELFPFNNDASRS